MLAADDRSIVATTLWAIASVGFLAAGFGILGVRRLYLQWQVLGMTATATSIVLLAAYRPATAGIGILIDLALLAVMGSCRSDAANGFDLGPDCRLPSAERSYSDSAR